MEELSGPRPAKKGGVPVSGAEPTEPVGVWTWVTGACYWILAKRAPDLTESTSTRSALVLAPHPDDETFGCAATILRKTAAGTRVTICVMSDGGAFPAEGMSHEEIVSLREGNVREAGRRLGIPDDDLQLLEYPDSTLGELVGPMANELVAVISKIDPDEIYIPSSIDWHADHVAVYEASLQAVERSRSHALLYTYPVWFWSRRAWEVPGTSPIKRKLSLSGILLATAGGLHPVKVRTDGYLDGKRDLMNVYGWELKPDFDFFEDWHLRDEELFFATSVHPRGRT